MNEDELLKRSEESILSSTKSINYSMLAFELSTKASILYAEAEKALYGFKLITYLVKSYQADKAFRLAGENLRKAQGDLNATRGILKELHAEQFDDQ